MPFRAAVVGKIRTDAVDDVALFERLETQRLSVKWVLRHGGKVSGNEMSEFGGKAVLIGKAITFDG